MRKSRALECAPDLASAEELIAEARNGRMIILVDDENRENEGDIIVPAEFAQHAAINFMAQHARGLICLAMTRKRVEELGLPPMSLLNGAPHQTAFTVSIEAREGVTTGISAHDRAHTIAVAIDPTRGRDAIVTPGHIFPLVAKDGGTLVRAGHTEAAVDIARLAGLNPAAVICEIMKDDGTMARLPDLIAYARRYDLKLGTIADLIAYRRRTEQLVRRVQEGLLPHAVSGEWRLVVYASTINFVEYLALVKGDVSGTDPVLVRVQAADMLDGLAVGSNGSLLHRAMQTIAGAGRGVAVLTVDSHPISLSDRVRKLNFLDGSAKDPPDLGVCAQILRDLGVENAILLSGHARISGFESYGLNIVEQRPLEEAIS